jgi:hypothetical protein
MARFANFKTTREIKKHHGVTGVFFEDYARLFFFAFFVVFFFALFFAAFFFAMLVIYFSLSGCDHSDNFFPLGKNLL